jgi:hypothetical protein
MCSKTEGEPESYTRTTGEESSLIDGWKQAKKGVRDRVRIRLFANSNRHILFRTRDKTASRWGQR